MLRHRFLTALATPAGPFVEDGLAQLELGRLLGLRGRLRQALRQRRVVAGEAALPRRAPRRRRRSRASRRPSTCRAGCCARRCCARAPRMSDAPGLEGSAGAPRRWRRRARRRSACSCSTSACTGSSQERVMPSRSVVIGIAHAAPRVVERTAAGARGRAAAAAARLLARHLARPTRSPRCRAGRAPHRAGRRPTALASRASSCRPASPVRVASSPEIRLHQKP